MKGIDADVSLMDWGGALVADGFTWVARYINPGKSQPLTVAEAAHLSAQGLYIVSAWEQGSPTTDGYFSADSGMATGAAAVLVATALGQPKGTPIYFAVDYDAEIADLPDIRAYIQNIQARVKLAGFVCGVYGSGLVCEYLYQSGFVSKTWLAQSTGFTGYTAWRDKADIVQGIEMNWNGLDVDLNESAGDAGGWQV